jgi:hypothetical protein
MVFREVVVDRWSSAKVWLWFIWTNQSNHLCLNINAFSSSMWQQASKAFEPQNRTGECKAKKVFENRIMIPRGTDNVSTLKFCANTWSKVWLNIGNRKTDFVIRWEVMFFWPGLSPGVVCYENISVDHDFEMKVMET